MVDEEIIWAFDLESLYSHRDPDDGPFRVHDVPDRQAYVRMDWRFLPDLSRNLPSLWFAERHRCANDFRPPLDGYWHTDTTLRYHGMKNREFAASVRNLFDTEQQEPRLRFPTLNETAARWRSPPGRIPNPLLYCMYEQYSVV